MFENTRMALFSVFSGLTTDSHERESAEFLFALFSNQKEQYVTSITLNA